MKISQVKLKGYRNFKDATINFEEKTLIIGSNDVGKSNLLCALRILLDRGLSDYELEPKDSDFFVGEPTNQFSILIKFSEVDEDCILAKMREYVSDEGEMYLAFEGLRNPESKRKSYKFFAGFKPDQLEEIQGRFYSRVLNLKYIGSNRDLHGYIRREKKYLLQEAKENRSEEQIQQDQKQLQEISDGLETVNGKVKGLSYIQSATDSINDELKELSFHHQNQEVIFDIGASDSENFIENIHLASNVNGNNLSIGGDGRNNQIFLALWAARNQIQEEDPLEISIYCIEEPEAHLHPHQQRKLAEYLIETLEGQVIITSHSPQIASEFSPNSIIRLLENDFASIAASDGCSSIIEQSLIEFGYRLNVISAEAFFARVVFLVEGASEVIFYKVLARELDIDLDRLNISIVMADGVGFEIYTKVLNALEIEWVLRTDNDIFKIPKSTTYRFAGIQRGVSLYQNSCDKNDQFDKLIVEKEKELHNIPTPISQEKQVIANEFRVKLEEYDIFLSKVDLENDLIESPVGKTLLKYYGVEDKVELLDIMQKRKATYMFEFLKSNSDSLKELKDHDIVNPLLRCRELAEQ